MDTSSHTMTQLFEQLGLNSSETAIAAFIGKHRLSGGKALEEASFWNAAQAQFLREGWQEDSDWAEIIDQLDALLRD